MAATGEAGTGADALKQCFPLRVVDVVDLEVGGAVDVLAEVEAAPLCLTS